MALKKITEPSLSGDNYWDHDTLGRRPVADHLTKLVGTITQPFSISLHSPYGTGKTFFIQRWMRDLDNAGHNTIYFNAWETDFSGDAFFAIVTAIAPQLTEKGPTRNAEDTGAGTTKGRKFAKRALEIGRDLGPLAVKIAARKIIGVEGVADVLAVVGANEGDIEATAEKVANYGFANQSGVQKSVIDFREELQSAIQKRIKEREGKKFIVFVDDLDRCRPDYSISVLECIKHFFSVTGLVFVLAIDNKQLQSAVASVFGPATNADDYLRKLIDWRFSLPAPDIRGFTKARIANLGWNELSQIAEGNEFASTVAISEWLSRFSILFGLSLRAVDQCLIDVNVVLRSLGDKDLPWSPVLGATAAIRMALPEILEDAVANPNHSTIERLAEALRKYEPKATHVSLISPWNDFSQLLNVWLLPHDALTLSDKLREIIPNDDGFHPGQRMSPEEREDRMRRSRIGDQINLISRLLGGQQFARGMQGISLMKVCFDRLTGAAMLTRPPQ